MGSNAEGAPKPNLHIEILCKRVVLFALGKVYPCTSGSTFSFIRCISLRSFIRLFLMSPVPPLAAAIPLCQFVYSRVDCVIDSNCRRPQLKGVGLREASKMDSVHGTKTVRLQRKKGGLGFSVKGGQEHGVPIVVSWIKPNGAAGRSVVCHTNKLSLSALSL